MPAALSFKLRTAQMIRESAMEPSASSEFRAHERRGQRRVSEWVLRISVLSAVFLLFGCGYPDKAPAHLEKIEGRTNAFRTWVRQPGLFEFKECVTVVRVFESGTDPNGMITRRLCWEVVATIPPLAKGFEIVAGRVPPKFVQIFPTPGEVFKPVPGRNYEITVTVNHPLARALGASTWWFADR